MQASFGTDKPEYSDEQIKQCKKLIGFFDAVSLREESGLSVISTFGWKANVEGVVLDPTMLLAAEDYQKVLPLKASESKGKIFYYVLDRNDQINAILSEVSQNLDKELYGISDIQKDNEILISIEEWLTDIRDAEFVITDSFHGMVFSILFHKQFTVIANKKRGITRFTSLLSMFGLEDRLINSPNEYKQLPDIDYDEVDISLEQRRSESLDFLSKALN